MGEQTIIPPTGQDFSFDEPTRRYAGVFRRFFALLVDRMIVNTALVILFIPLGLAASLSAFIATPLVIPMEGVSAVTMAAFFFLTDWVYFAWLESSDRGATLGKRLFGLRVVSEKGERISFSRASIRYFSKFLSALPMMLGFVMAFFTKRTQALHDLIAETVVIRT